jgi:hypothetical protein
VPFSEPPTSDITSAFELTRKADDDSLRVIGSAQIYISLADVKAALDRDLMILIAEFSGLCVALRPHRRRATGHFQGGAWRPGGAI